jgi:phosphohistidine swiveling domain-containing protein
MTSSSPARPGRLISLDDPAATRAELTGGKAAALARARQAGLPALPGYVAPIREGAAALRAGCAALREAGRPAARRAVLAAPVAPDLAAVLARAVTELGGRAIVRSSSPLEADPRWSGAFSSIREIGPGDVTAAARSCWSSAFAPDPLDRLEHCGLDPAALGLSLLVQPDLDPEAGGLARLSADEVEVTWVTGHPGAMLAGAEDGETARAGPGTASRPAEAFGGPAVAARPAAIGRPAQALGGLVLRDVAALARAVQAACGDDVIEWAWAGGRVILLQCGSGARTGRGSETPAGAAGWSGIGSVAGGAPPLPGAGRGAARLAGRACVMGDAIGRLRYAAPGRALPASTGPASPELPGPILVAARPLASLAPLLFGARGIVCQSGAGDSHLAGVARALGVPMLVQVPLTDVVGPLDSVGQDPGWLAVISGQRAELDLVPWLLAVDQDLQLAGLPGGVNRAVHAGQRKYGADERAEPDLARGDELDRRREITRH